MTQVIYYCMVHYTLTNFITIYTLTHSTDSRSCASGVVPILAPYQAGASEK
jgi:hypothetical protein